MSAHGDAAAPHGSTGTKAERTRELLADTALGMFRAHGYDATTMRGIAREAGVSTGNAYYHFAGKDAFVHELYRRVVIEHRVRTQSALIAGGSLADNLRRALTIGVEVMAPYHSFGSTLLGTALRMDSETSPFSAASRSPRTDAVALMREVVDASARVPGGRPGERLPELLWLANMGVTLFWVLDSSPDTRRTALLIDGAAPLVGRMVSLARIPIGRSLAADAIDLMDRVRTAGALREGQE